MPRDQSTAVEPLGPRSETGRSEPWVKVGNWPGSQCILPLTPSPGPSSASAPTTASMVAFLSPPSRFQQCQRPHYSPCGSLPLTLFLVLAEQCQIPLYGPHGGMASTHPLPGPSSASAPSAPLSQGLPMTIMRSLWAYSWKPLQVKKGGEEGGRVRCRKEGDGGGPEGQPPK